MAVQDIFVAALAQARLQRTGWSELESSSRKNQSPDD
jgi:hypothetical protein